MADLTDLGVRAGFRPIAGPDGSLTVDALGRAVLIAATDVGCRLEVVGRCPAAGADVPTDSFGLPEPGDTDVVVSGEQVRVARTLVAPTPRRLRAAAIRIVQVADRVARTIEKMNAELARAHEATMIAPALRAEPDLGFADTDAVLRSIGQIVVWVAVPSARPYWTTPDCEGPGVGMLEPGRWYELCDDSGVVAGVYLAEGEVVYTQLEGLLFHQPDAQREQP